jgi:hypothetical protein
MKMKRKNRPHEPAAVLGETHTVDMNLLKLSKEISI